MAVDLRWSGRTCGPECGFRRSAPLAGPRLSGPRLSGPRAIASWPPASGTACTFTKIAADQDRHRIAQAFVAAALRLGPAAVQSCRERP
jgi:hypothetical protein